ncbi:MAG TPA: MlaE family lipid ABC transporter permease subunit [Polyangiaceae bacterium]|nr:MlaE family lipid ABC transporter permease subunit [Polyangiaceae bacterium]
MPTDPLDLVIEPQPLSVPSRLSRLSRIEVSTSPSARPELILEGDIKFSEAAVLWTSVSKRLESVARGETLDFDMSRVESVDGGTMALLVHLRNELKLRGVRSDFVGATGAVQELVHLYGGDENPIRRKRRRPKKSLEEIGERTQAFFKEVKEVFAFLGDMLLAIVGLLREPRTANWKELPHLMERTGADAVPIVVLINFLVGFVMAFQGAVQLKQFGANIFVADLVALSVARELGPLMTAIIVCGRSGASFAAELGTMKVSEEIDALRTMGFGPIRYLVLPRALALVLVLPMLTLLADMVAIGGGLVVGLTSLDLSISAYLGETRQALSLWDILSGVVKSVVFAVAIALIACQQGFATSGGAEGVGRRTTSSVVAILFALILIDAAFTVFFHTFGL